MTVKKALVIGGSGFLGSHVAGVLTECGYDVCIFDQNESPYIRPDQKMIRGSILDQEALFFAVEGCDYVYNFAGIADIQHAHENPIKVIQLSILGNNYILEAAVKYGVKRIVFASSVYVYSDSGSFYGVSK